MNIAFCKLVLNGHMTATDFIENKDIDYLQMIVNNKESIVEEALKFNSDVTIEYKYHIKVMIVERVIEKIEDYLKK